MSQAQDLESAGYRAGLELLARLPETGSALSGEEASDILGTRTVKGIGAAFSGIGMSLEGAGIRPDEAVGRRTVRGGLPWTAGPRLRQTRHVLERTRRYWIEGACEEIPLEEPAAGNMRPVPMLRALGSRGTAYRFDRSLAELVASLDNSLLDIPDGDMGSIGETSVRRIEPGRDGAGIRSSKATRRTGTGCAASTITPGPGSPERSAAGGFRCRTRGPVKRAGGAPDRAGRRGEPGGGGLSPVQPVPRPGPSGLAGGRERGANSSCRTGRRARSRRAVEPRGTSDAASLLVRSPDPRRGQIHRPPRGGSARRRCAHGDPGDRALARPTSAPPPSRSGTSGSPGSSPGRCRRAGQAEGLDRRADAEAGDRRRDRCLGRAEAQGRPAVLWLVHRLQRPVRVRGAGQPRCAAEGPGEVRRTALGQGRPVAGDSHAHDNMPAWSLAISAERDPDVADISNSRRWADIAGAGIGLGEVRPQRGGLCGRFEAERLPTLDDRPVAAGLLAGPGAAWLGGAR